MASRTSPNGESALSTFMEITDSSDRDAAELYLQMANGHVDRAVSMWMEYNSSQKRFPHAREVSDSAMYEEIFRDPDEIYSQKLLSDTGERTQFNRLNMGNIFAADTQNKEERPQRGLSALFAPPVEMNCEKPFETARELACSSQRWLLVNIQRNDNFYCHRLNRDIWSNESVREVLKSHYVFWQREAENDEAADLFCELYDVTDFPYVAVIDPRTGVAMKKWPSKLFLDPLSAVSELIEFTEAPVRKVYPPTVAASADISPLENNVRSQIPQHTRVHQEAEQFRDEDSLPEEQPSLSNVNRDKTILQPYKEVNAELAALHRLRGNRTKSFAEKDMALEE